MNTKIIYADLVASMKGWMRSRGTIFWAVVFPVLLILLFGAIFSGTDNPTYTLYVQDKDDSTWSHTYVDMMKNISVLKIEMVPADENITGYIQEQSLRGALVIPEGFSDMISRSFQDQTTTVNMSFYFDPSEQGSTSVVRSIIGSSLQETNLMLSGGRQIIGLEEKSTITKKFKYIDFFIPGMIGFTIMQMCIYGRY